MRKWVSVYRWVRCVRLNYVTFCDERMPAYRYRMSIPGEYLKNNGWGVEITQRAIDADIHFYSKPYHDDTYLLASVAKEASSRRFIFDICDDVFWRDNSVPDYTRMMANLAEIVTVPTVDMGEVVKRETGCDSFVIPDPCEFKRKPIKDISNPRVMWFGTYTNMKALKDVSLDYPLEVVCSRESYKAAMHIPSDVTFTEWSLENMEKAFERNNIVIIPVEKKESKNVKSPNRVVEAIRNGLSVVAGDIPSYHQFGIRIDSDMNEGISNIVKTTESMQDYVDDNFDISVVGEQWLNQLNSTLDVAVASWTDG